MALNALKCYKSLYITLWENSRSVILPTDSAEETIFKTGIF